MKVLYTAVVTTKSGRNGQSVSSDEKLHVNLSLPVEMGGTGKGTNPEQLFAAGYSACFGSAIDFVAQKSKKPVKDIEVTAHVSIGPREDLGFQLAVRLDIKLPGIARTDAESLVAEAHQVCPYSHSIKGNVDVQLNIVE